MRIRRPLIALLIAPLLAGWYLQTGSDPNPNVGHC